MYFQRDSSKFTQQEKKKNKLNMKQWNSLLLFALQKS